MRHPIREVAKKAGQLKKVLEKMEKGTPRGRGRIYQEVFQAAFRLDRLASSELAAYKLSGSVSRTGVNRMRRAYGIVQGGVLKNREWSQVTHNQPQHCRLVLELGEDLRDIERAIEKKRVLAHQHNSALREYEAVLQIWGRLAKKGEKRPTVSEIEQACYLVGDVYAEDASEMKRLVNLIRANRIPQEFEMRYRSNAPRRPWVRIAVTVGFPPPERVLAARERTGWDGPIFIAATKPSWRIIWKVYQ